MKPILYLISVICMSGCCSIKATDTKIINGSEFAALYRAQASPTHYYVFSGKENGYVVIDEYSVGSRGSYVRKVMRFKSLESDLPVGLLNERTPVRPEFEPARSSSKLQF